MSDLVSKIKTRSRGEEHDTAHPKIYHVWAFVEWVQNARLDLFPAYAPIADVPMNHTWIRASYSVEWC